METYLFGSESAPNVLIQPVDDHDLAVIESEAAAIRKMPAKRTAVSTPNAAMLRTMPRVK